MENKWLQYCISQIPKLNNRYKALMHKDLNLSNPKTLTEKIQWLKIYDSTFLKTYCSDKITVRDFCYDKLNHDYFIPLIGTYSNFNSINFSNLPLNYVMKTNHGSHTNIIVKNGNINMLYAQNKFNEWLNKDWSWYGYEMAYKPIPRKILIEKYMNDGHSDLIDYKFLCFNGVPRFCQIIGNRNDSLKHLNYYDMNFNPCTSISRNDFPANYNIIHTTPSTFTQMKSICNDIAKYFKFVRIDFYEINNKPYLGELTFFPGAGFFTYKSPNTDIELGNLLDLTVEPEHTLL